jgi:hypothetical protein
MSKAKNDESDLSALLCVAKSIELPDWATHVAVSTIREGDVEPCAWLHPANDYIDEDPNNLSKGDWSGCYKRKYWRFFSREELYT